MRKVDKTLKKWTGQGAQYWFDRIGALIARTAKPVKGYAVSTCDPAQWVGELAREICKAAHPKIPTAADENITAARLLSLLLAGWFARIARAKAYDPRRPVKVRRQVMGRLQDYSEALLGVLTDESMDPSLFPAQEWDVPFAKNARYEPDDMEKERQRYAADKEKKNAGPGNGKRRRGS